MFKGKIFGDVIAGIAKDGRNTLVLWCQFDGGCELRLSAMATMVDDEMLCDGLGDRETMVLLDQSQREIDAGRDAGRRPYVSVPTEDAIRLDPDRWILSLKASGISPVRRRSTPVQQSSPREGKCARADARNAPASARSVNDTPQRDGGQERIDSSADDNERIGHRIVESRSGGGHAKAVRYGTLISRKHADAISRTSELAIRRLKRGGRTGEVEHLEALGYIKTDRAHGLIIGKFDLQVI